MKNALAPNFSSAANRNDDTLARKWSAKPDPSWTDPGIDCTGDSGKTDQSFAKDADINNIVATYHKTGVFPSADGPALFADVSDAPSYQDALQIIINAENAFMSLDAKTRKKFDNDPAQMLSFLEDPKNRSEAAALGMLKSDALTPSPAVSEPAAANPTTSNDVPKSAVAPKDG